MFLHFLVVSGKFLLILRGILLFEMKQEVLQAIKTTLKQVLPQGAQAFVYIHFTPFFHNVKDEGVRLV